MENAAKIFLMLYFLFMCVFFKVTHMDKSDLEWISEYRVNDRFVFVSDSNTEVDTMTIIEKNVHNSYWPVHWPKLGFRDYEAGASLKYVVKNRSKELEGWIFINKYKNRDSVYVELVLGNRYAFDDSETWPLGRQLFKYIQTVKINNYVFKDCVIMDESNSQIGDIPQLDNYIDSYIWSKSKGLLQYTYNNGEVFTRKEYINSSSEKIDIVKPQNKCKLFH